MALTTIRTEKRAVAQAISAVAAGTASSQGISFQRSDSGGRKGTASTPKDFKPARAQKEQAGEQCAQSGGKQGGNEIMPFHRAGDEGGQRPHLVQQRHHLVMGVQAGAGGERHRRGGGARDQQQYSVGGIAHGIGQPAQPRDPAAVIVDAGMGRGLFQPRRQRWSHPHLRPA